MRTFPGLQCQELASKSRMAARIERGGWLNRSKALLWHHWKAPEGALPRALPHGAPLLRGLRTARLPRVELALAYPRKADRVLKKTVRKREGLFFKSRGSPRHTRDKKSQE